MPNLVLFEVAGRTFALPADALYKVVDPVPVTPLPFLSGDVEGMVLAGGVIVAQIDLARRIGLPPYPAGPSALMLVGNAGRRVALRVGGALTKIEIDDAEIRAADATASPVIAGEFFWQGCSVSVLHLDRVGLDDLAPVTVGQPMALLGDPERLAQSSSPTTAATGAATTNSDSPSLVVRCGGEPFALRFDQVLEVVSVERLTPLPQAPAEVLGITVLRGTPLIVLSLAHLLGKTSLRDGTKIPLALVRHGDRSFALAVDAIVGVRRLNLSGMHPLAAPRDGLAGYHIGDNQALTGLIDIATLLATASSERLLSFLPTGAGTNALQPKTPEPERSFLTFLIGSEMYGIDIDRVERIAEHRTPLPLPGQNHGALTGMVDIAGRVVPVADLRRRLGRPNTVTHRTAFVLARGSRGVWAVVVDRLSRIVRIPISAIKAAASSSHFIGEIARLDRTLMPILDPLALDSLAINECTLVRI